MVVSNNLDVIKPIKKAALLHNEYYYKVYNRLEFPKNEKV